MRLAGKCAVVTGATSGIGRGVVARLAREGARVVFCGRNIERGQSLQHELGDAAQFVKADVTKEEGVEYLAHEALSWLGRIDCLFNNAADVANDRSIGDVDAAGFLASAMSVFGSVVLVTKAIVPVMSEQRYGSIINSGSTAAHRANSSPAVYSSLKAAVCHFTRCIALEVAPFAVRANTISPGAVATPAFIDYFSIRQLDTNHALDAIARAFAQIVPLGRGGTAEDIASAVVFFASDESQYVTGQDLVVDGGLTAGLTQPAKAAQAKAVAAAIEATLAGIEN